MTVMPLDIRCPHCNAAPNVFCRTPSNATRQLHEARKHAAKTNQEVAPMNIVDPDDIPIRDRIGRLTRTSALTGNPVVISEDDAVAVLTHHWPWIEAHIREQVALKLLAVDPVDWALAGQHAGKDAARIARGTDTTRSTR